jgi:hypothetical protein
VIKVLGDRAEFAGEAAAAPELQQADRQIVLSFIQVTAGHCARLGNPGDPRVARLQLTRVCIRHNLRPNGLGVTGDHTVSMFRHLIGDQGGMHPTHHQRHLAGAVFGGDLIGPAGGEGFNVDGHQIGGFVVINFVHAVIEQAAVHARRGQPGQDAQGEGFHAGFVNEALALSQAAQGGLNKGDLHPAAVLVDGS